MPTPETDEQLAAELTALGSSPEQIAEAQQLADELAAHASGMIRAGATEEEVCAFFLSWQAEQVTRLATRFLITSANVTVN